MTKQCAHCGGGKATYCADDLHWHKCPACDGTGVVDDAEYEPEICPGCEGNGCSRCKGSGEVWRKVDGETTEGDE